MLQLRNFYVWQLGVWQIHNDLSDSLRELLVNATEIIEIFF